MDKLIELIRKMKNDTPDSFSALLEQMKHRASMGKLPGVTSEMIDEAYNHILFEDEEMCVIPASTLQLFLEAEEVINEYPEINEQESFLNEGEIFNKMYSFEEEYIDDFGSNLLEDILEVNCETI